MSLCKRIIACLDVKEGRTVKGIRFEQLRDMGDPVEQGLYYAQQGIDELVFLDISAGDENRKTRADWVRDTARQLNIPFTVGGGISGPGDVERLLENGADKISVNTAAVKNPDLISQLANRFGSQCVVLAVDAGFVNGEWMVFIHAGKTNTGIRVTDWTSCAESLGVGEILLTSIGHDGRRNGFNMELTGTVSEAAGIPVIASGGAGRPEHFEEVFKSTAVSAALAAGIFHEKLVAIPELKKYLATKNITVR